MFNESSNKLWYKLYDGRWVRRSTIDDAYSLINKEKVYDNQIGFLKFLWKLIDNGTIIRVEIEDKFTNDELLELALSGHKVMAVMVLHNKHNLNIAESKEIVERWMKEKRVC